MNYALLSPGALNYALQNADASEWARAFRQFNPHSNIDDGVMTAWFANCYMAGFDKPNGGGPLCGDHAQWLIENGD